MSAPASTAEPGKGTQVLRDMSPASWAVLGALGHLQGQRPSMENTEQSGRLLRVLQTFSGCQLTWEFEPHVGEPSGGPRNSENPGGTPTRATSDRGFCQSLHMVRCHLSSSGSHCLGMQSKPHGLAQGPRHLPPLPSSGITSSPSFLASWVKTVLKCLTCSTYSTCQVL